MRKLISVLMLVLMVGCATTSGWEKDKRDEAMDSCMSSLITISTYKVAAVFCPCMLDELEKSVPTYDETKIAEWFTSGSSSIAGTFCTEEVKTKLNLK